MTTLRRFPTPLSMCVVPGAAPGATGGVSGLRSGDSLISVRHVSGDLVTNADLTGDFSITGNEEVTNGGAVDTSGNFLIVVWTQP